jgi:hypothetical protein
MEISRTSPEQGELSLFYLKAALGKSAAAALPASWLLQLIFVERRERARDPPELSGSP